MKHKKELTLKEINYRLDKIEDMLTIINYQMDPSFEPVARRYFLEFQNFLERLRRLDNIIP